MYLPSADKGARPLPTEIVRDLQAVEHWMDLGEPAEFPTEVKEIGSSSCLILLYSENKAERLAREPDEEESTLRAYPRPEFSHWL